MKHTKQVDNSSLDQTKPKTTRLQKGLLQKKVSCGMVLVVSTMLHEKCCNTVLQIGAPQSMDQPGKVANPARGQLNMEIDFFPVPVRA